MRRPLAIDLFCGLGGWSHGLIAEGWDVIGFDIEAHAYDGEKYPGQLVLQDVMKLNGAQFKDADLIVASPPCQEFSYMAMPWARGKQIARALRGEDDFPEGYRGSRTVKDLTALFDACFRIQREASVAAWRYIPMVVENVRGAQDWVGKAKDKYGSYFLWGDIPELPKHKLGWDTGKKTNTDRRNPPKYEGGSWFAVSKGNPGGRKAPEGTARFNDAPRTPESLASMGSKSPARKAASARIAKIPEPLARHIARVFYPCPLELAA